MTTQDVKELRKLRAWLIEHPGATTAQISNIFHRSVTEIYEIGLAKYKKDKAGLIRWYVNADNPRPWQ